MVTVLVYTFNTLLLFSYVYGDYDCICNYRIETPVYMEPDIDGEVLGYLYEFDCKPQSLVHSPGWEGIAFSHQIGYIMEDSQIQVQICSGVAPPEDRITTRRVPSTEHLKYTSNKQHTTTVPLNRTNVPPTSTSSNITANSSLSSTPVSVTLTSNVTSFLSKTTEYKETTKLHSLSHIKTKATSLPSNKSTILTLALNTSLSTYATMRVSGNTDNISSTVASFNPSNPTPMPAVSSSSNTDMASFNRSKPTPMPAVSSSSNTDIASFNRSNPTPMPAVSSSSNTDMASSNRSNPTPMPAVSSSSNTDMASSNRSNPTQMPALSSSFNTNMVSVNRSNPTPMLTVSSSPYTDIALFNKSNTTPMPTISSSPYTDIASFNNSNTTPMPTESSPPYTDIVSFNHSNPTSIVSGRSTSSPPSSSILITSTELNHVQNITMTNTQQFNNTVSRTSSIFAILTNTTKSLPSTSARTNVTMETQRTNIFTLSSNYSSSTSPSEVISTNVTESTKTTTSLGFQTLTASTQKSTDTLSTSSTYHYTEMSTQPRTTTSTLLSTTTGPVKDRVDLCPYQYLANDYKGDNNYPHFRQYGDFCFEIRQEVKDWFSAQDDCVARGGDLAVVKNDEVERRVQSLISTLPDGNDVWIGLSVPNVLYRRYHWVDGTFLAYSSLTDKGLFTPGSTSGRDCVVMDTSGTWTNVACKGVMNNGTHHWVCQYSIK